MTHLLVEEDSDNTPNPAGIATVSGRQPSKRAKTIQVLLIEDSARHAQLIRQYLALAPEGLRFEVTGAGSLAEAQSQLARRPFDVLVADLWLPDSNGFVTFERLHQQAPLMPLVVLTGDGDEDIALRALRHGAEDHLVKGSVSPHLLIRSLRFAIERGRRRQAERALRDTGAKMQAARKIQQKLFPARAPQLPLVRLEGRTVAYDLSGASFPAEVMGGDYFDYIPMMHGSLGLVIGDVSGHGYGPALLMVETRAQLRALAHTFDDVSDILNLTNRVLMGDMTEDHFVTLFFGQLDVLQGTVTYTSAGHTAGFWLDAAGRLKQRLESTALPLGIAAETSFPASPCIQLLPGDVVVLLTDGVLDATAPDGTQFGGDRALAIVRHFLADNARDIVSNLYHSVRAFVQSDAQIDDITALVLKVKDQGN
jgi:serine phosphatase RsbU (regulator of sigma subunit)